MRLIRQMLSLTGLLALGGLGAGCGTIAATKSSRATANAHPSNSTAAIHPQNGQAFAWLAGGSAPPASALADATAGGVLLRPSGWRTLRGDPGSVSFVLREHGAIVGYLNATPRSGAETLANWSRFRPAHNREEGDRDVRALAAATGLSVDGSRASCVIDQYRTSVSRYREIACLVARSGAGAAHSGASAVVLGAAPPSEWARQRPIIEHAIASFLASRSGGTLRVQHAGHSLTATVQARGDRRLARA